MRLWWHPESECYVRLANPTDQDVMELLEVTRVPSHEAKAAQQLNGGNVSEKIDSLVEKYVKLRDKKSEIATEAKGKIGKIEQVMDQIEGLLLKVFQDTGQESARTAFGTAYKSPKTSCTVADKDQFLQWCLENDAGHLLDIRALKTAVEQYKGTKEAENAEAGPEARVDVLPPGLNWTQIESINVRRST